MAVKPNLSAPLAHREFNGEHLFAELKQLRMGQVAQKELNECALSLRRLTRLRAPELAQKLRLLSKERAPALGTLLKDWAAKVNRDEDVPVLVSHVQRLAMTSALLDATRRASARLPPPPSSSKGGRR